jgi:transcriptional regulator with GAF, ATPase, and Fis domain
MVFREHSDRCSSASTTLIDIRSATRTGRHNESFHDHLNSRVTFRSKFAVRNTPTLLNELCHEVQNGVRLSVDYRVKSGAVDLIWRQSNRLADCRMSTEAVVAEICLSHSECDLFPCFCRQIAAAEPLIHRGEVLGVLGVFSRTTIGDTCLDWLRMIADHAAASLANAAAWEQIETLRNRLELENEFLQEEARQRNAFGEMIGQRSALQNVAEQIELVAATDSTVLITGDSGTGKELVAREIHNRSSRGDRPLIKVNCAAVPRELYDSEFFGHTKGSFSGAVRDRAGRFELADGGKLLLDKIGEIPLDLQSKLLRVLQEGDLERVGEERTRKIDVRIIAATYRDLKAESGARRFRRDLYYRLSVFPIEIPPLAARAEDISLLENHFLTQLARRLSRPTPRLTLANVQELQRYNWPGNIRELQHVLERALITAKPGKLRLNLSESNTKLPLNVDPTGVSAQTSVEEILTASDLSGRKSVGSICRHVHSPVFSVKERTSPRLLGTGRIVPHGQRASAASRGVAGESRRGRTAGRAASRQGGGGR